MVSSGASELGACLASELSLSEPTVGFPQPMVWYLQIFFFFFLFSTLDKRRGKGGAKRGLPIGTELFPPPLLPSSLRPAASSFSQAARGSPCSCYILQLKRIAEFYNNEEFSCHVYYCTILSSRLLC